MYQVQIQQAADSRASAAIRALVELEGTVGRSYVRGPALQDARTVVGNLADAIHYLCVLHGRQPGVVEIAATMATDRDVCDWMVRASSGFTVERAYITRLAVLAGPQPSTPGQAESETTVTAQRHALEILSRSDRDGCALGAALALVLDWRAVREVLDRAALRFGLEPVMCHLPFEAETLALADHYARNAAVERAMQFGAQQLLAQHRGLWNLLEARHLARPHY
jgi:hypothetical protein